MNSPNNYYIFQNPIFHQVKYIHLSFYVLLLGALLSSCGGDSPSSPPQQQTPPSQVQTPVSPPSPEVKPEEKITNLLLTYYNDLSAEQLDESQYFAPTLDQFFSSKNISRSNVGSSIRKGFESLESRSITLDRNSIKITPQGDGYIAEFKGTSTVKRVGASEITQEAFHNRVGFSKDFLIVSYGAADAPKGTREVAPDAAGPSITAVVNAILPEFRTGRFARTHQYIHPQKGYYLITHPGAVSIPFQFQKIDEMFGQAPWFKNGMTQLNPSPKEEALPDFDCGDMFSKEGSFLHECPPYDGVSDLMKTLAEYELGSFEQDQIDTALDLEQYVTHALIDTKEALAFYFGQIEGQWYLLIVDIASYDCSA